MDGKNNIEGIDRIHQSLCNKTIFLTGGTGFLGKVLIERLLRIFDVKKIYILIRTKKDKNPGSRLEEIFLNPLFDKVRQLKGQEIFQKCQAISGDVSFLDLGISDEDVSLLQNEVEFVYHSAATVRFDTPLKTAIAINTKGTQQILNLSKGMRKLQVFVHISTAYCHPEEKILYEKIYKSKLDPEIVIDMINWFSDKQLEQMTPGILDGIPNTYTFTKALAEEIVAREMGNLPVVIVRPSIVVPMWKEPIPGWNDNLNGPAGLLIAAGKGVLRTMHADKDAYADFVPVDGVADAIFVFSTYALSNGFSSRIFNISSGEEVPMTWGDVHALGKFIATEHVPFDFVLWSPGGSLKKSKLAHQLAVVFFHFLPALMVDLLLTCFGYKPFLWRVQKRILQGMNVLEFYTNNEWRFNVNNAWRARDWMNNKEKSAYVVFYEGADKLSYFTNGALGARRFILKEPDENLPKAKRNMKILVWVDRVCNVIFKILFVYLCFKLFSSLYSKICNFF